VTSLKQGNCTSNLFVYSAFMRDLTYAPATELSNFKNMGHRLSKIATRTGDDGTTGLGDGSRTDKDALRVQAMGDVDELNSHIGVLLCEQLPDDLRQELITIQHDLFDLSGELCIPGFTMIQEAQVLRLDELLAKYNATLPPLSEFILPGGSRAAAQAHICRTVCRRAERSIVSLGKAETLNPEPRQFVNRLSDLLFVLSRVLNRFAGGSDVLWEKGRNKV
jgi:cob(I)alamin adenosyltransferase